MDIHTIITDLIETRNLQDWVNNRYRHRYKFVVDSRMFPVVVMGNNKRFRNTENLLFVEQATKEYVYDGIHKSDKVVDIGANVGGFSINASEFSNFIYAVEPLYYDELHENIALNNATSSIDVIAHGLGSGEKTPLLWQDKCNVCRTLSFKNILKLSGGCDFLKVDCEGYEWFISPSDLDNIRRIEIEFHPQNPANNDMLPLLAYLYDNYTLLPDPLGKDFPKSVDDAHRRLKSWNHFILHLSLKREYDTKGN